LNVTTGKLAANAVTAGKLDDLLTDSGGTAAAYTNASITVDATGRVSAVANGPSEPAGFEYEVITGSITWNRPTGATLIRVVCIGGGGGGATGGSGGGGGDGGAICDWIDVSSVSSVAVTIGAGGATGGTGSSGGNTTFGSYLTANGGSGGSSGGGGADGTISGSQTSAEVSSGLATTVGDGGGGAGAPTGGVAGAVVVQVIR
jgi:hypothetical protein